MRMKSGKLNQPILPDVSIEWLLQTYLMNLQADGETVHLIPISITKDRIIDMSNLTNEMISNREPTYQTHKIMKTINDKKSSGGVGRVFMKVGEEIDLKKYLEGKNLAPLRAENFA